MKRGGEYEKKKKRYDENIMIKKVLTLLKSFLRDVMRTS